MSASSSTHTDHNGHDRHDELALDTWEGEGGNLGGGVTAASHGGGKWSDPEGADLDAYEITYR